MQNNIKYIQTDLAYNQDINRHIESLRARLGFAKFKLNNGWENNTLLDVECLWKQKQKQLIKDIPIPRFTQQHIIDKCIHNNHHPSQYKRSRLLNRSLSSPVTSPNDLMDDDFTERPNKKYRRKSSHLAHSTNTTASIATAMPTSPANIHDNDNAMLKTDNHPIKNSLDFLSYAIAMTEKDRQQDNQEDDQNWTRTSQLRLSLSIPNLLVEDKNPEISSTTNSISSSSTTTTTTTTAAAAAAAHAMMMFVNSNRSST
ncbi:hypothetical protein CU097_004167 [Rhizopus azygosporus]|uniref:Uncharacterized protein n=1 Tax=Rhizopus azygosporus TaxID=86630 RepID=A0A367J739_RHIAZ|nr:hypothetical protein CU097_004167 [Rhizopus azygosporus]